MEIVDCAGNDEYSKLSRNATVGVHGYILVYSLASRSSLENLRNINKVLFNMIGNPPSVPRVVVGTMLDASEQRVVSYQQVCRSTDRPWPADFDRIACRIQQHSFLIRPLYHTSIIIPINSIFIPHTSILLTGCSIRCRARSPLHRMFVQDGRERGRGLFPPAVRGGEGVGVGGGGRSVGQL